MPVPPIYQGFEEGSHFKKEIFCNKLHIIIIRTFRLDFYFGLDINYFDGQTLHFADIDLPTAVIFILGTETRYQLDW